MLVQEYLDIFSPKDQRKEITNLYISNRNLHGNLDLTDFVNLKKLWCSGNKLTSLNLTNCSNLKTLDIKNTDISHGLEYLPESLEEFKCEGTKLANELETYGNQASYYRNSLHLLQLWKKAHLDLVETAQKVIELEKSLTNLNLALVNGIENKTIAKGLDIFQLEIVESVKELKKQNQEYYQAKIVQIPKS